MKAGQVEPAEHTAIINATTPRRKRAVKKDWIENLVVKQTMKIVMDDPLMERITDRLLTMQGAESYDMQLMQKQLAEVETGIENMVNAIQAGIITSSTRQRLADLEQQKDQLEKSIWKEKSKRPILNRDEIRFFLNRFKNTDVTNEEQRQSLIDCFVNAVYVYDDKIVLVFNYKDGTKTVSLADVLSSDLEGECPPNSLIRTF